MGDVSKHFNRSEFACKGKTCGCNFAAVDVQLLQILEAVREHFGRPLIINCACRCEIHNATVGGAKKSFHLYGMAADIVVKGVSPAQVFAFISTNWPNSLGLIQYPTFTHIDVRGAKFRQVKQ